MEEKIAEAARGRWKGRQTGMCCFLPANTDPCKSRGEGEQRRGVLGPGENHVVQEVCRNALGVEGGRGVRKGREGDRHKGRDIDLIYVPMCPHSS